jgi:protein-S-isoprenylcysteine O-methyltransferase Ste14
MGKSVLKIVAATALFGVVHSVLASRTAKRKAAEWFGERNRNGLYRAFYIGQSLVTFAALAGYIRRQPGRELYHVRGPLAGLLRLGQAAGLVHATWAARQVGVGRMLGADSLAAWWHGRPVPPEPEAQGPALGADGTLKATGPFALSRHPLNLSPLPVFWLNPRMSTNLAAFNLAATAYFVLGSLHEETRLAAAYGEPYRRYEQSDVPFYLPRVETKALTADAGGSRAAPVLPSR